MATEARRARPRHRSCPRRGVVEHVLAPAAWRGRTPTPTTDGCARWTCGQPARLYLDGERPLPRRVRETPRFIDAGPGSWGIAILSRLPVLKSEVIELGRLPRDPARRAALLATVESGSARSSWPHPHDAPELRLPHPIPAPGAGLDDRLEGPRHCSPAT